MRISRIRLSDGRRARAHGASSMRGCVSLRLGAFARAPSVGRDRLATYQVGRRRANPNALDRFSTHARSQAPFLSRRYPASSVLRACPPPQRPGLSVAGFQLAAATHHRWGFPCCVWSPFAHMPSSLPRQDRWEGTVARLSQQWQSSPFHRRVGFCITLFEACSTFTRVTACMLADFPTEAFS